MKMICLWLFCKSHRLLFIQKNYLQT